MNPQELINATGITLLTGSVVAAVGMLGVATAYKIHDAQQEGWVQDNQQERER